MVKILSINKKGKIYSVTTNEKVYKFLEDVIIKYIISKNKEYTKEEFLEIESYSKKSEFYNKVLNFLSYKDRSINEIRDYLVMKDCLIVDEIINDLISKKILDDSRYAKSYMESCINNLKGPLYLKQELYKKRINDEIITEVVEKYSNEIMVNNLNLLVDKELRKEKLTTFNKYKNQLTSKFLRLGFNLSNINQVLYDRQDDLRDIIDEALFLESEFYKLEKLPKNKIINKLVNKGLRYSDILEFIEKNSINLSN